MLLSRGMENLKEYIWCLCALTQTYGMDWGLTHVNTRRQKYCNKKVVPIEVIQRITPKCETLRIEHSEIPIHQGSSIVNNVRDEYHHDGKKNDIEDNKNLRELPSLCCQHISSTRKQEAQWNPDLAPPSMLWCCIHWKAVPTMVLSQIRLWNHRTVDVPCWILNQTWKYECHFLNQL